MPDIGDGEEPAGSLLEGPGAAMPDAIVGTDAEFRVDDPETGQPLALATIMRDLTDQRRLDTILAAVTDGIYALDVGLRFTYVNDAAVEVMAEMLGRPLRRGDLLGRAVFDLFPGVKDKLEALYRAPLGGTASRFE
jgi:hypothetical protein